LFLAGCRDTAAIMEIGEASGSQIPVGLVDEGCELYI